MIIKNKSQKFSSINDNRLIYIPDIDKSALTLNIKNKKYKSGLLCITNTDNAIDLFNFIFYHKNIVKFDKIVIMDNQSSINLQKICNFFDNVEYFDARSFVSQPLAYNEYINFYNDCEWLLCIDDDEYLYISDKYKTINNYIDYCKNEKNYKIGIPWVLMYLEKNTLDNPVNIAIDSINYIANEKEYEDKNNLWNSMFLKTLFYTVDRYNYFCEDRYNKFNIITPEEFYKQNNILNNRPIEYGSFKIYISQPIDDVMGNLHNPLTFDINKKLQLTKLAYDDKYVFGFRRIDDNNIIKSSDISILHFKYQSINYYKNKISKRRFSDCIQLYYERNYNMDVYNVRYNAHFDKFDALKNNILKSDYYHILEQFKSYYFNEQKMIINQHKNIKYTIITTIFNNYDLLREPYVKDPNCEYICITDNKNLKSNTWKIILENEKIKKFNDPRQKTYYVRYHLFEFSNTYYTIWIDASMQIKKSFLPFIKEMDNYDVSIIVYDYAHDTIKKYLSKLDLITHADSSVLDKNKQNVLEYIRTNNIDINKKGLYAATIRICKNTETNKELDELVYNTLQKISTDFYYDEIVYSTIINNLNLKIYPLHNCILYSDFCIKYKHNSKQPVDLSDYNCLPYNDYKLPLFINNIEYLPLKIIYDN